MNWRYCHCTGSLLRSHYLACRATLSSRTNGCLNSANHIPLRDLSNRNFAPITRSKSRQNLPTTLQLHQSKVMTVASETSNTPVCRLWDLMHARYQTKTRFYWRKNVWYKKYCQKNFIIIIITTYVLVQELKQSSSFSANHNSHVFVNVATVKT